MQNIVIYTQFELGKEKYLGRIFLIFLQQKNFCICFRGCFASKKKLWKCFVVLSGWENSHSHPQPYDVDGGRRVRRSWLWHSLLFLSAPLFHSPTNFYSLSPAKVAKWTVRVATRKRASDMELVKSRKEVVYGSIIISSPTHLPQFPLQSSLS